MRRKLLALTMITIISICGVYGCKDDDNNKTHSETLMPLIEDLFNKANLTASFSVVTIFPSIFSTSSIVYW